MRSPRSWGTYDERELIALLDNYMVLRYMKHRPTIHVRLMDLEVAMRRLPRRQFEAVLVYGILRFAGRAAGSALHTSEREVKRRYRHGIEQMLYTLNGEDFFE